MIVEATGINGSAINVSNIIKMVEQNNKKKYTHEQIKDIFSSNRQVLLNDIIV